MWGGCVMQETDKLEPFKQLSQGNQQAIIKYLEYLEYKQKAQQEESKQKSCSEKEGK
jgi:hypothetical protein